MSSYAWKSNASYSVSGRAGVFEPFEENLGGFSGSVRNGSMSVSQSLVLNREKGELVKTPGTVGRKGEVSEAKIAAALKSHSEAERRRRERINTHLATLRGLVPCTEKMDKATLLAEVIREVKQLKKNATEASEGLLVPMDADEVSVEPHSDEAANGTFSVTASICCNYRPGLLSDIRRAFGGLHLDIAKAEVSTFGGRMKNMFIVTREMNSSSDAEAHKLLVTSVHQALTSILDKVPISPEYSPRTTLRNKRRRVSSFGFSSSSS